MSQLLIGLLPKEQREVINKAIRFVKQDITLENINESGKYEPVLKRFEVVHVNFTGIGFEWDLPHYAMVWDVHPVHDTIEVIPMTSSIREEFADVFSVGIVSGLPRRESTLLVSDRTRVSRKRIKQVTFTHPKHGERNVSIAKSWESRIMCGIMSRNMKCKTFQLILSKSCGVAMVGNLTQYNKLKFKAIIDFSYNNQNNTLIFREWDSINIQEITLIMPKEINTTSKDVKTDNLKDLNAKHDINKISDAKQYFNDIYGI